MSHLPTGNRFVCCFEFHRPTKCSDTQYAQLVLWYWPHDPSHPPPPPSAPSHPPFAFCPADPHNLSCTVRVHNRARCPPTSNRRPGSSVCSCWVSSRASRSLTMPPWTPAVSAPRRTQSWSLLMSVLLQHLFSLHSHSLFFFFFGTGCGEDYGMHGFPGRLA